MISYLQADNIARRIGDHLLFENISLNVNKDDKEMRWLELSEK